MKRWMILSLFTLLAGCPKDAEPEVAAAPPPPPQVFLDGGLFDDAGNLGGFALSDGTQVMAADVARMVGGANGQPVMGIVLKDGRTFLTREAADRMQKAADTGQPEVEQGTPGEGPSLEATQGAGAHPGEASEDGDPSPEE